MTERHVSALDADVVLSWYERSARDLPWRQPGTSPWAVLVSEVMLAQTPVARVEPVWRTWCARWPGPADLAATGTAEVIRAWGKLGYPRRALRLHAAATAILDRFGGTVPSSVEELETLPGIGAYTARAVAAFAFGARTPVVDTNVARVLARAEHGEPVAPPSIGRSERSAIEALLPTDPAAAARFSVAVMELGALVCTAAAPRCAECPLRSGCAWVRAGMPAYAGPPRRTQKFAGTDRQVRGLLLDVLRGNDFPASADRMDLVWPEPVQRRRALESLIADGLVELTSAGDFTLAGEAPTSRPAADQGHSR